MDSISRRELIGAAVSAAALGVTAQSASAETSVMKMEHSTSVAGSGASPDDESYWRGIAADFDLPPGIIQLENGNWGAMARPVLSAYTSKIAEIDHLVVALRRIARGGKA